MRKRKKSRMIGLHVVLITKWEREKRVGSEGEDNGSFRGSLTPPGGDMEKSTRHVGQNSKGPNGNADWGVTSSRRVLKLYVLPLINIY